MASRRLARAAASVIGGRSAVSDTRPLARRSAATTPSTSATSRPTSPASALRSQRSAARSAASCAHGRFRAAAGASAPSDASAASSASTTSSSPASRRFFEIFRAMRRSCSTHAAVAPHQPPPMSSFRFAAALASASSAFFAPSSLRRAAALVSLGRSGARRAPPSVSRRAARFAGASGASASGASAGASAGTDSARAARERRAARTITPLAACSTRCARRRSRADASRRRFGASARTAGRVPSPATAPSSAASWRRVPTVGHWDSASISAIWDGIVLRSGPRRGAAQVTTPLPRANELLCTLGALPNFRRLRASRVRLP